MSINDPKIGALREAWNACQRRHEIAYAKRAGSWNGSSRAGKPLRFVIFCERIESYERARVRFAAHAGRVERALFSERLFDFGVRLNRAYADLLRATA